MREVKLVRRQLRPLFGAVLLLMLALPCRSQAPQSPSDRQADGLGMQVQDQPSQISPAQAEELFKSVDEILAFASRDTKLPIKNEVKRRLVDRNEVQNFVEKGMKDDKDTQRLERSEAVLKKFGLLPRDFDLKTFLVVMLKEQVAGYYDPKTRTVNMLNWVEADAQKPVLAHELTHALQDQSFGLEKWLRATEDPAHAGTPTPADISVDEEQAARQAVVEGQAMVTLLDYTLQPTGKTMLETPEIVEMMKQGMLVGADDSPSFRSAPVFLKEMLTFPYRYGIDFAVALLQSGGKELAFAGALKDPPRTTREVMEPQSYLSHEKLEPLKLLNFDKDFAGYERFDIGAMGEFDVNILVEQFVGADRAAEMYPHWRGGYYFAGRPKGDKSGPLGLLYVSRWSSADSAAAFAAIYARSLAQRYKKAQALGGDGKVVGDAPPVDAFRTLRGRHAWMTDEGTVVIDVRGDTILISESLDDATTKRAAADLWAEGK